MAVLKNKSPEWMIPVGTRVRSVKIGARESFEGVITEHFGSEYHVQDDNGKGWLRSRRELSRIETDETAV